jgi:hypothetical protein
MWRVSDRASSSVCETTRMMWIANAVVEKRLSGYIRERRNIDVGGYLSWLGAEIAPVPERIDTVIV